MEDLAEDIVVQCGLSDEPTSEFFIFFGVLEDSIASLRFASSFGLLA